MNSREPRAENKRDADFDCCQLTGMLSSFLLVIYRTCLMTCLVANEVDEAAARARDDGHKLVAEGVEFCKQGLSAIAFRCLSRLTHGQRNRCG